DGGIADGRRHALFEGLVREFFDPDQEPGERDWEIVTLRPTMAGVARAGSPEPKGGSLFGGGGEPDPDEPLIQAYVSTGRTLDDLPYTPEFERLHRAAAAGTPGRSQREVFHRLHNLRKAGRLPRIGKSTGGPARIDPQDEA